MKISKEIEGLRGEIHGMLQGYDPTISAMFLKNWNRYKSCLHLITTRLPVTKESTILDYGCGHPLMAKMLEILGYDIIPYDPYAATAEIETAKVLQTSREILTDAGSETYDVVLMIDVIEHLSIIKPIMNQVNQLVKEGGHLFVSTPNVHRIELWYAYLRRTTGHPQSLKDYLNTDNNYTYHQREFNARELKLTLKHFGFDTRFWTCLNTLPDKKVYKEYAAIVGKEKSSKSLTGRTRDGIFGMLKGVFPRQLNNNLFMIGEKVGEVD